MNTSFNFTDPYDVGAVICFVKILEILMKPIQGFKVAARLACEWQDSVYYSGLGLVAAGAEGMLLAHGYGQAGDVASIITWTTIATIAKESVRCYYWTTHKDKLCVAGDMSTPVDAEKNIGASGFVAYTLLQAINPLRSYAASVEGFLSSFLPPSVPPVIAVLSLVIAAAAWGVLTSKCANIRDIPDLYFNKDYGMWDYARRGNKNGPTQTEKLKDAISKLGKQLVAGTKRPVPVHLPARSLAYKARCQTHLNLPISTMGR